MDTTAQQPTDEEIAPCSTIKMMVDPRPHGFKYRHSFKGNRAIRWIRVVEHGIIQEIRRMITYSVTVTIDREIEQDWLQWMRSVHIPEVMATGCFLNARLTRLLDPPPDPQSATFNIQYACDSIGVFKRYQDQHAPALQASHRERYEGRFAAFRTILRHESEF